MTTFDYRLLISDLLLPPIAVVSCREKVADFGWVWGLQSQRAALIFVTG